MKSVTSDFLASTGKSKAITDDESPSPIPPAMLSSRCAMRISFRLSPVSPEPMSIHDSRCTKWDSRMHHEPKPDSLEVDTLSVGQFYVHRLIWSSAVGKLVELSAHCPHDDTPHCCNCPDDPLFINAIKKSQSEVIEKDYDERLEMRLEEAKRRLEAAKRRQEEAKGMEEEALRRLKESERREAESYMILSQAMEKAERIKEETRKMEEDKLSEFKEWVERRASEAEKSIYEAAEWAERTISEALQRLELENEDDDEKEVEEELAHSGRDCWAERQLIQVREARSSSM